MYQERYKMLQYLKFVLATEYNRHSELASSDRCNAFEKRYFEKVATGEATEVELTQSILYLTMMLHKHYNTAPIVIIDEYDGPIQQGFMKGYYEQSVTFIRNLFSAAFKDNSHLSYGFLTEILRVAKESVFSGLNNMRVYSILDDAYSEYFGFTPEEVRKMAAYYGELGKYDEICEWYDGYRFGNSHIFNPWSVINYFDSECHAQAYWLSTSSNDIIGEIVENATQGIQETLYQLLQGEQLDISVDTGVIYPDIRNKPESVFNFLLVAGYLKITDIIEDTERGLGYRVGIPNMEIQSVYRKEILITGGCLD